MARVAFSICVGFSGKVVCGHFCIACLRPLTQR
ncbi:DUF3265 domain-containing protein [Vibrio vulnificus]|nr:DUF3265 domain-containing protein [Vibrio vulnificus]